jgi:hypothetical protein
MATDALALLSLGLGIGSNAVIFSLISTILLRPLPISHPEQVFAIHQGKEKACFVLAVDVVSQLQTDGGACCRQSLCYPCAYAL